MTQSAAATFQSNKWLFLLVIPLLAAAYATVLVGMAGQWSEDPNYSHGFLVPVISGWFLWQRKDELLAAPVKPANSGLAVLLFGMVMLVAGIAGTEFFTMRTSFIVVLTGIVLYWFGWEVLKVAALPLGFLVFMVPLPYIVYDAMAFPLKLFVAKFSVGALKEMGILVWRDGNIIQFPTLTLEVADACSGLRSLMSLLTLSVAYAFLFLKPLWTRLLIVLLVIPVAIFTNMLRVIVTGVLANSYGAGVAEGFFHEFAGMAVFVLAMVMLVGAGVVMRKFGGKA